MLLAAHVTAACVQDGHGAAPLLRQAYERHPSLRLLLGDQLYGGPVVARAMAEINPDWQFHTVKRPPGQKGFTPLPRRWVVERTFAWISRCRRLARDFERYARTSLAMLVLAMLRIMLKRLAKPKNQTTKAPS